MAHSQILGRGGTLRDTLREAAGLLAVAGDARFLAGVLQDTDCAEATLGLVSGLDHVGFMLAAADLDLLATAAAEVGFDRRQQSFPSTIITRQLGELAGRETVPTTIFKAWGQPPDDRALEVAIPHGVDAETVRRWVDRGIGAHIAFRVETPAGFWELRPIMEEAGFRMPAFMHGGPLSNPAAGMSAVFFERRPKQPLGVEFCHYERRPSLTPRSPISSDISSR